MLKFIFRRAALIIPTFIGVTLLTFALVRLVPGDPLEMMAGERGLSPERHAVLMEQYGFDKPLLEQYGIYLMEVAGGNFGRSVVTKKPVMQEFFERFPATVELALCAMIFAVVIGLPMGVIAAVRRGTVIDYAVMGTAVTGFSMPIFWWALLLVLFFSVNLGWTPVSGRLSAFYWVDARTGFMLIDSLLSDEKGAFGSAVSHLILPSVALGTIPLAIIARMTRSSMLEVLHEDYVRTARAKGLSPFRVVAVHALRNALIPVITVIGLATGILLAGAILTETIFSWPGIGKWLIEAVRRRDYPTVQGGVLLVATIIMIVNLLVDLLYGVVNPRIRHAAERT